MTVNERYMMRAIGLAGEATGRTFPNPLVGAVVVEDGEVVGEGYHRGAGNPHAEIEAISMAGERAKGASLYLNLEPCCHHGRTPPCTDLVLEAGISRVFFSTYDPDPRVRGKGAALLREGGVEVHVGLCAGEAFELNLPYIHRSLTGRTFVVLKLASTLDGRLTAVGRRWLTGEESRRYVHFLRAWTQAIAIGIGTLEKDDPALDRRLYRAELQPPVRMVFDSSLRFPPDHAWLESGERVLVYCTEGADSRSRSRLEGAGAEVVELPGKDCGVDLGAWMEDISGKGIVSVLVEGGGAVAESLIREGLFDRLVMFYAPVISGADQVSWFGEGGKPDWLEQGELTRSRLEVFGDDIMVIYDRSATAAHLDAVL